MTEREMQAYWEDKAVANTTEFLTIERGWGGVSYSLTGQKPYLPKEGKSTIEGWTFSCKYWDSPHCGKRAYINYRYNGKAGQSKIYIAKELTWYDNAMHYTYWLTGASDGTENFVIALKQFLEMIWTNSEKEK